MAYQRTSHNFANNFYGCWRPFRCDPILLLLKAKSGRNAVENLEELLQNQKAAMQQVCWTVILCTLAWLNKSTFVIFDSSNHVYSLFHLVPLTLRQSFLYHSFSNLVLVTFFSYLYFHVGCILLLSFPFLFFVELIFIS